MRRNSTAERATETRTGHCVVCDAPGTSVHDFICSDCGDPLSVTLYCRTCGRRLALDPDAADRFLRENGHAFDDLAGLVLKVTRCGACMAEDDTVDMQIFRVRLGG